MARLAKVVVTGLLCIGLGLRGIPGQAQVPDPPGAAVASEADALLAQAKELFQQARYREALPLLERAYALTREPRQLFNLGVVHHKLSECEPAREYFERYLAEDPSGSGRTEATWALQELYDHCPGQRPAALPEPLPSPNTAPALAPAPVVVGSKAPAERPAQHHFPSDRALILLGTGAAAGVAALVSVGLQSRAQHDIDALHARASASGKSWDGFEPERRASSESARRYHGLSIWLGLGCAALVGTGTAFWIFDGAAERSFDVSLTTPGMSYRGRF